MKKNLTKQYIAGVFKSMAQRKAISDITVSELAETCGINRGTFYYQFDDIVSLIRWILHTEILEHQMAADQTTWRTNTLLLIKEFQTNHSFYDQIIHSQYADEFRRMLYDNTNSISSASFDQLAEGMKYDEDEKDFIVSFFSNAYTEMVIRYIAHGAKQTPETVLGYYSDIIQHAWPVSVERAVKHVSEKSAAKNDILPQP